MVISRSVDAIAIHTGTADVGLGVGTIPSLDYATDLGAILAFFGYAIIIAAAMVNRKTRRVKTDKV
jgi:hypothetical protein